MPKNEPAMADSRLRVGLIAREAPVPLQGVSVRADVTGECARVTITQRYRNREAQPIEAVYVFPLDEGAAVCGFEAVSAGVHYVGEVKPRDEAFEAYDDALQAGHSAYLLDEERPDVFTASLGNVPPGAEVLVRLTYVTELAAEGDALRFTLPTTVSPRYAPPQDRAAIGRSDAEALNPPVAWRVPYGLDLTIHLTMPGEITRVESPSHPLSIEIRGTGALVTLAQAETALDRDVVLLVGASGLNVPHALVERDERGEHAAAVAFLPRFDADRAPSEIVFLVDRSGSMRGTSIAEVRNALQLCLRSILPGSRFNIVGFGSTYTSLFEESLPYDENTLARATAHVESLDADLGQTEILSALQFVFSRRRAEDLPRQLVVLTDGEVTNTDAVIGLVRKHAADCRVFPFGIGAGASTHLVRGLARAGNGVAEFIAPGERAEAKVLRQFARLLAPALTDVTIDWGGLDVTSAPTVAPAVFAGGRLLVYGFVKDPRPATITLSARGAQGGVSFSVPLDPGGATKGSTLVTLAARERIRELEESPDGLAGRGSRQLARKVDRVRDQIVSLATHYGLVSRETSFVAVERRDSPLEGESALRRIPVALTSGWGSLQAGVERARARRFGLDPVYRRGIPTSVDADVCFAANFSEDDIRHSWLQEGMRTVVRCFMREPVAAHPADVPVSSPGRRRPHDRLVSLQRADGSWDLTPELGEALGIDLEELLAGVREVGGAPEAPRVWATALALAWIAGRTSEARDEWALLARKAIDWLKARSGEGDSLSRWLRAAEEFMTK